MKYVGNTAYPEQGCSTFNDWVAHWVAERTMRRLSEEASTALHLAHLNELVKEHAR